VVVLVVLGVVGPVGGGIVGFWQGGKISNLKGKKYLNNFLLISDIKS